MLDVPSPTILGEAVELTCSYELEPDLKLYSVKWYKDGVEFYRYVPNDYPAAQTLPIEGIKVELARSTAKTVYLSRLNLDSEGKYKCEVSAEAPEFKTAEMEKDMEVYVLPQEGPQISGSKSRYNVNDIVLINCTSAKSKPAASLKWYINESPAPVEYEYEYPTLVHSDRLETSVKSLRFKVNEKHLRGGNMKLKCTATLSKVYVMSIFATLHGEKKAAYSQANQKRPAKVESTPSLAMKSLNVKLSWLLIFGLFIQVNL
ncbi:cell adhesion molecule 3-like isoform X3 [Tetranychus urticae]|nr:cell adhesion molecule 3-like isoform X3 [Tetranychus urticae]